MCTVLLPPGDNPIAVNRYINIIIIIIIIIIHFHYFTTVWLIFTDRTFLFTVLPNLSKYTACIKYRYFLL
jgi:hypothetical protein